MERLKRFEKFSSDPGFSKIFSRLSDKDREACREFIQHNDHLSHDEFAFATNRWMLDKERPKRFSDMWALVFQSNGVGPIKSRK